MFKVGDCEALNKGLVTVELFITELKNDEALLYAVEIDTDGYGIVWNDDIDLSCDELFENGETVAEV